MRLIAKHLINNGIQVISEPDNSEVLSARPVDSETLAGEVDLIIAVGGDGTLLHAAAMTRTTNVPLLGVNRGRLGFLTDISPEQMLQSVDQIIGGRYAEESRLRLAATITTENGAHVRELALNDVVLQRRDTGRILEFETRIADQYVNTHMADGLVVATPTGSTAYALSCGGPIIEPQLDAVVVVPICPHTLSDRPIVIPANQHIELTLLPRDNTTAEISVDGHAVSTFAPGDKLNIGAADSHITLIHPPGYDYYQILRSKLNWGRDSRIRHSSSDT